MLSLVMQHMLAVLLVSGPAKSWTKPLGVSVLCMASLCGSCATGGVPLMGGPSGPSVSRSPGVTLQEKAGRPMGPSTLRCEFPWEVVVVYVGLLFWLFGLLSVPCEAIVISQGSVVVFGTLSPSRPDPCSVFECARLLLLSGYFRRRRFSLVLSLSLSLRRWGNPSPIWGLGFPLCSLLLAVDFVFNPYSVLITYPKASPRTCFFFLSSLGCRLGVFLVSCLGSGWFLRGRVLVGLWFGCLLWSVMVLRLLPFCIAFKH